MSAAIAGVLVGGDLIRLATTGRLPPGELRHTAFAAATLLAALGLTGRHTLRTLELARRIEYARLAQEPGVQPAGFPTGVRRTGARRSSSTDKPGSSRPKPATGTGP